MGTASTQRPFVALVCAGCAVVRQISLTITPELGTPDLQLPVPSTSARLADGRAT
eukprot:COSAG02_NODE_27463_length_609_cov_0.805882_1_plen_54_part_01